MIIIIDDYEKYELKYDMSDLEKFKVLLKQVNSMKTHIDNLEDQIIKANGYRIQVVKQ
jgi:hypothetical protein